MTALRARSIAGVLILGLATTLFVLGENAANAGGSRWRFNHAEKCLMTKMNKARRRHGKRAVDWDRQLGYVARQHAKQMASQRAIWHDGGLTSEVTRWRRLGQNTGTAGGCRKAFRAFMRSSAHRSNLMGWWKHNGVGAVRAGGHIWVQHVFQYRRDPGNIYHYP